MFKEKIEEYISKYHFLYAHDIQVLSNILIDTEQYKANLEKYKENEIENYLKFLESFFLFTDLEIFNGKGLKFIQYDIDYLATPSYARTSIVMTLLGEYGFTFEEILNNNALSKRKLIKIEDVSVLLYSINTLSAVFCKSQKEICGYISRAKLYKFILLYFLFYN